MAQDNRMNFYKGTGATPVAPQAIETRVLTDAAFDRQTSPENYRLVGGKGEDAVSYTHLTLPTIYSV